jgi:hypothetical protein
VVVATENPTATLVCVLEEASLAGPPNEAASLAPTTAGAFMAAEASDGADRDQRENTSGPGAHDACTAGDAGSTEMCVAASAGGAPEKGTTAASTGAPEEQPAAVDSRPCEGGITKVNSGVPEGSTIALDGVAPELSTTAADSGASKGSTTAATSGATAAHAGATPGLATPSLISITEEAVSEPVPHVPAQQLHRQLHELARSRSPSGRHARACSVSPLARSLSPPNSALARLAASQAELRSVRGRARICAMRRHIGLANWNAETTIPAIKSRPGSSAPAGPRSMSAPRACASRQAANPRPLGGSTAGPHRAGRLARRAQTLEGQVSTQPGQRIATPLIIYALPAHWRT